MKKSMRILCIIFAIICFAYYIRCAAYAGVKSSFIWIWLVGTAAIYKIRDVYNILHEEEARG